MEDFSEENENNCLVQLQSLSPISFENHENTNTNRPEHAAGPESSYLTDDITPLPIVHDVDNDSGHEIRRWNSTETGNSSSSSSLPASTSTSTSNEQVTIHRLLPPSAAFLAPVKYDNTLYYGMSVNVSRMQDAVTSEVQVNIKSKYPDKFLKKWLSRKNQNPLQTRVTVRQLKELITNHKMQCGEKKNESSTSSGPVHTETADCATLCGRYNARRKQVINPEVLLTNPGINSVASRNGELGAVERIDRSLLDTAMAMSGLDNAEDPKRSANILPFRNGQKVFKSKKETKKPAGVQKCQNNPIPLKHLNEKIVKLQIGTFKLDEVEAFLHVRVYWKQKCFVYELQTKQYPIEDSAENPELEPILGDPIKLYTTLIVQFHQIQAMHFKPQEMLIRLNSPPNFSNAAMDIGPNESCPIPKGYDITEGQSQTCFIHYLKFARPKGAYFQHALLKSSSGDSFSKLMVDEISLFNPPPMADRLHGEDLLGRQTNDFNSGNDEKLPQAIFPDAQEIPNDPSLLCVLPESQAENGLDLLEREENEVESIAEPAPIILDDQEDIRAWNEEEMTNVVDVWDPGNPMDVARL